MKDFLVRLAAGNRPRVIAVFGTTRVEVECAIRHAQTSESNLPIWAWCVEEDTEIPVDNCARFTSAAGPLQTAKDLSRAWPALSIVAWTGKPGAVGLKLLPLAMPPFRVVLFNEAEGFFAARPALIAKHLKRRLRDGLAAKSRLVAQLSWSLAWRTGERIRDGFNLMGSFAWRTAERVRDGFHLIGSLAWRAGERLRDGFNWLRESLLAFLALTAQLGAKLSYNTVRRARSKRPWSLRMEESASDSYTEVAIPNRGWPRRAVMAAVAQSDAEFIVLRMRGEKGSAASLIAIARDTNAFAVAKQVAHSAWRRQVVNKHPFRRLQEDEVSEVFAPFSTLLVLRRKMLVSLGIPRALTYGGALMLLFWKSSAAGLRSLAAGHRGPVADESAMDLEDAELALRLSVSTSLAALGPQRPARFRGNVAWSPAHSKGFRGKPRVLIVSPYLPFPLSHGGAVRIYNLCRALACRVDFVLACFHEAGETVHYDELHEVFREVYVVDADEKRPDPSVPNQIAEYRNPAMSDLIRSLCLHHKVDLVQLEYTQMAEYQGETGAIPVILVEHDITFTLYSQLADFNHDLGVREDYRRWLEFERTALQCSNLVWTMSAEERAVALEYGAPRKGTRVIPNGVDLRRFTLDPKPAGPPVVLFVGSFRHLPNLLAYESLCRSIMPAVWRECPDAVLHVIAGPHHERAADSAGKADLLAPHSGIVIDGWVEDVRPAYRAADVVAVPLPLSAGTNIKLLEAMACGRAIVSTPAGCRGLDLSNGQELVVADLDSCFSGAVVELLRNEGLRTKLALAARWTAERRFSWDTIAEDALECYAELAPQSAPAAAQTVNSSA